MSYIISTPVKLAGQHYNGNHKFIKQYLKRVLTVSGAEWTPNRDEAQTFKNSKDANDYLKWAGRNATVEDLDAIRLKELEEKSKPKKEFVPKQKKGIRF